MRQFCTPPCIPEHRHWPYEDGSERRPGDRVYLLSCRCGRSFEAFVPEGETCDVLTLVCTVCQAVPVQGALLEVGS